jgi:SAM-dependent methyltransferase
LAPKRRRKLSTPVSAFDAQAAAYDQQFTASVIGTMMRKAVWARCAARFTPGSRILEMNCGTGEDALWLARQGMQVLATDISSAMLQVAQQKLRGVQHARVQRMAWEELGGLDEAPFDGALSNFGGLNCVSDLRGAARALAARLRDNAVAILCIMGPTVPWEWLWYLAHGRPGKAFRRLRRAPTRWSGIAIYYPSIAETHQAFAPEFRMLRVSAIGALLPPPFAEGWMVRHPRWLAALERMERRVEARWPLPLLADHYLVELQRLPAGMHE